jgi:hypothetical protein
MAYLSTETICGRHCLSLRAEFDTVVLFSRDLKHLPQGMCQKLGPQEVLERGGGCLASGVQERYALAKDSGSLTLLFSLLTSAVRGFCLVMFPP